jgi:hypothetical protein
MGGKPLYPNVYVMLVGPPATGKSLIIGAVLAAWRGMERLNIAPDKVTTAAAIDALMQQPRHDGPGGMEPYHSLSIGSPEFGSLMSKYDVEFLSLLNGLYDCDDLFKTRTRGGGVIEITKPHVMFIGGTQPHFLAQAFPKEAWTQGFASRAIMVYIEEGIKKKSLFGKNDPKVVSNQTQKELGVELRKFLKPPFGKEMTFSNEAEIFIDAWHDPHGNDENPKPVSPRAAGYNARRPIHLMKLAMLFALSEFRQEIKEEDIRHGLQLMEHTEEQLEPMFKAIQLRGNIEDLTEVYNELAIKVARTGGLINGQLIRAILSLRVYPPLLDQTFKSMISTGLIRAATKEGPDIYRLGKLPDQQMEEAVAEQMKSRIDKIGEAKLYKAL